ncbi:NADPH-dependent F420 reductase [Fructobacillus ficulneus]|uniref:Dinucleotide-binding protein n=1 Tax=Fructobacillus ficulneus TaxID=157463 RepID=A0A0K8MHL1_9LACO|nr:NADPH-dependent F420 reductase [Fructobacillus ficulneus]GAO99379.1 dinucleotide-binding protein [Fructobacillus ficulneus]
MKITIFGKGNMGSAIGSQFEKAGNEVAYVTSETPATDLADLVVLAVPYAALTSIAEKYKTALTGKTVFETTNPVNFQTFDSLEVPAASSATSLLQELLPDTKVLKAFNTTFAATLATGKVGPNQTTVLTAGDDQTGKDLLTKALTGSDLTVLDAGSLSRAQELEALGFLQLTLAAREQIGWTGGFAVVK